MSNPYTFYIGDMRVVVYAPTRAEATRRFVASLEEHDKQIRTDAIDECISLARAEIDFESQAEQKRFVEFMEQLKEQKNGRD